MHIVARAEAYSDYSLHHLSDPDLLANTRGQVGRSNQILAALLAHLAEVEARGLYRSRACSSLYTYCIYELRMSEDAALRRAHAARILRHFPVIYAQIAAGELHLTAVLMLGPHLTEANHVEVLARAKYRTKKEVQALVRQLDPLPDVPACVEGPLGRDSAASPPERDGGVLDEGPISLFSNPSFGKWTASLCGPVRELPPGERPRDWGDPHTNGAFGGELGAEQGAASVLDPLNSIERGQRDFPDPSQERVAARRDTPASLESQRYKVQFTASQEYVDLLEEARDLLAHAVPNRALDEVHLRALRLLVAELKKRKYGLTDKPRARAPREGQSGHPNVRHQGRVRYEDERGSAEVASPLRRQDERGSAEVGSPLGREAELNGARVARGFAEGHERAERTVAGGSPRQRGRYVPAAVRRAVAERDCERCAYVDDDGRRCRETSALEFHHLEPHACGGPPTEANLSLRCRAHNGFAAEQDFGREFMAMKKLPHPASARSR